MSEAPEWPTYRVGPKDSVFAVGVVSVNYARLEHAVHAMFAVILGIDAILSSRLMFKLSPEMRDKMMREMIGTWPWHLDVLDLAKHFIEAHKICYENRNKLMHSNLISGSEKAITFYKSQRDGTVVLARPSLAELRRVADDMQALGWFAIHLSTMIRLEILKHQPMAGDLAFHTWPDKPPLPIPLEYAGPPNPVQTKKPPAKN
ncbi:MAG: hypothetical protein WCG92_14250 [Hyphomicrobiales bacterium]